MTIRHLIDGLMQTTHCKNHGRLAETLKVDPALISRLNRMGNGKRGISITTLVRIHHTCGIPYVTLMAWFEMKPDEVLGRLPKAKP